jgi:pimeloyl-ACP methyl ester carboxylesterase
MNGRRIVTSFCFALILFSGCGCAARLAVVKTKPPHLPTTVASETPLDSATKFLAAAEHEQPSGALGDDLMAARICYNVLERRPNDESARNIYNFATARVVQDIKRAGIEPWHQSININTDEGRYLFSSPTPVDADHDPSRYDLVPTDTLTISGRFYQKRSWVSGIGAPLVAVGRSETPQFRELHRLQHIYAPVTAVIRFSGRRAQLDFIDPLYVEQFAINKHVYPLAADFSAATAMLIAGTHPEKLGFSRVINPDAYAGTARLYLMQEFDHVRTPVVFVHGLQETPASWAPMINTLRDDQWIREHYQFWFFSYPSGYPYPYSAALLRRDLDDIKHKCAALNRGAVFIGHSMGGMICRLMITDAGDKIWQDLVGTSPAKTPLTAETRRFFEEALVFNHRPEVKRVVFISTPHRGSDLATGWIGRLGSGLVKTPHSFRAAYAEIKPLLVPDPAAATFKRMPNSVDTLEPNDRFVRAVNKLPITPGIPYHCIMGDRGRGDTPNSSDGVVPYWSSHLDRAQSELVVNSDHGAQCNPQAIAEVKRILRMNLSGSTKARSSQMIGSFAEEAVGFTGRQRLPLQKKQDEAVTLAR